MFHIQAVNIFFVAPRRFSHICPETADSIINRFLLIFPPPVGNFGNGKIYYSTIPAPRPRHIVSLVGTDIFYKITQLISFQILFVILLRNNRILRNNHFKTIILQFFEHCFWIGIIAFSPFKILKVLSPTDILINNINRDFSFTKFCRNF